MRSRQRKLAHFVIGNAITSAEPVPFLILVKVSRVSRLNTEASVWTVGVLQIAVATFTRIVSLIVALKSLSADQLLARSKPAFQALLSRGDNLLHFRWGSRLLSHWMS